MADAGDDDGQTGRRKPPAGGGPGTECIDVLLPVELGNEALTHGFLSPLEKKVAIARIQFALDVTSSAVKAYQAILAALNEPNGKLDPQTSGDAA